MLSQLTTLLGLGPAPANNEKQGREPGSFDFASIYSETDPETGHGDRRDTEPVDTLNKSKTQEIDSDLLTGGEEIVPDTESIAPDTEFIISSKTQRSVKTLTDIRTTEDHKYHHEIGESEERKSPYIHQDPLIVSRTDIDQDLDMSSPDISRGDNPQVAWNAERDRKYVRIISEKIVVERMFDDNQNAAFGPLPKTVAPSQPKIISKQEISANKKTEEPWSKGYQIPKSEKFAPSIFLKDETWSRDGASFPNQLLKYDYKIQKGEGFGVTRYEMLNPVPSSLAALNETHSIDGRVAQSKEFDLAGMKSVDAQKTLPAQIGKDGKSKSAELPIFGLRRNLEPTRKADLLTGKLVSDQVPETRSERGYSPLGLEPPLLPTTRVVSLSENGYGTVGDVYSDPALGKPSQAGSVTVGKSVSLTDRTDQVLPQSEPRFSSQNAVNATAVNVEKVIVPEPPMRSEKGFQRSYNTDFTALDPENSERDKSRPKSSERAGGGPLSGSFKSSRNTGDTSALQRKALDLPVDLDPQSTGDASQPSRTVVQEKSPSNRQVSDVSPVQDPGIHRQFVYEPGKAQDHVPKLEKETHIAFDAPSKPNTQKQSFSKVSGVSELPDMDLRTKDAEASAGVFLEKKTGTGHEFDGSKWGQLTDTLDIPTPKGSPIGVPSNAPAMIGGQGNPSVTSPLLADDQDASSDRVAVEISGGLGLSESRAMPSSATQAVSATRVEAYPVLRQISEGVARITEGAIEIRLSPEELGNVRMQLVQGETSMTVHITADRPETLDLMKRHIDQLAKDLAAAGYEGAEFSFGGDGGGGDRRHDGDRSGPLVQQEPDPPAQLSATPIADGLDLRF